MRIALTNFTGGEVAPSLSARYDLSKYKNSVQCMENFLPNVHGNVERRPGMQFMANLGSGPYNDAILIPFSFNVEKEQNFVLILTHKLLRVANHEGLIASVYVTTPWDVSDLRYISFSQVGDIIYMAHKDYALHKIIRSGSAPNYHWSIQEVALNTSLPAPARPTVSFDGENIDKNYTLRYKVVAVDGNGIESLASELGEVDAKHPSDWIVGNSATITWSCVNGAVEYNVYREEAGYFGFIGVANAANSGHITGLKLGTQTIPIVKHSGLISRNIVLRHYLNTPTNTEQWVTASDETSQLNVIDNESQNAFIYNNDLFVWVARKTITTRESEKQRYDEYGNITMYWDVTSVETNYDYFWAMTSANPTNGFKDWFTAADVGSDNQAPYGDIGPYSVSPIYSAGAQYSFTDNNYEADIADTPKEDWNPFANGNNPGIVSFHQQRMILGATPTSPQAFYLSRIGDFENFRKSRPLQDDDPVEYHIASGNIDTITWAASFGDLLLGTSGSEYKVSGDGAPITPSSVSITAQSYWGSSSLPPIIIGNSVVHVQRHGARVRDLFYSLEKDGYAGNDLSIMAPHLFEGHSLRQWAYQQTPSSSIWIVRDDGLLLGLTYMKEHDIWGWSRHITNGKVRSIITLSGNNADDVFLVVQREINGVDGYYLEKLAPHWQAHQGVEQAFFVDCGITKQFSFATTKINGLEHLENCAVSVLADGSPIEDLTVKNGEITLPYAAKIVHIGLGFSSKLSPLPIEGDLQSGTSLAQMRGLGQCSARLYNSVGGKYGPDTDNLFDFPFVPNTWGSAVEPFSGDIDFIPGGGQSTNSSLWIVQDRALPFSLSALVLNMDIG